MKGAGWHIAVAGTLLVAMLGFAGLDGTGLAPLGWTGGLCAWAAASLLWRDLSSGPRRQCVMLISVGAAAMVWAVAAGGSIDASRVLDENLSLLAMLAGVSFIRLASSPLQSATRPPTPRGPRSLLTTLLGLNVLGSAINITALVLVADRIARNDRLHVFEASALARAFSLAVLYSPFIGGMAFALNRAPDANLANVAVYGIALSAIGIGFTWISATRSDGALLAEFEGYPLRPSALWFPALLATGVLAVHFAFAKVPVLTVIAVLAPVSACVVLLARIGVERAAVQGVAHVLTVLPQMVGELWLFLSAGVLAVGVSNAIAVADVSLPLASVGAATASVSLLAVVLLAAAGLHPVIALSALIPLLQQLSPSPELIVLLCVCAWSIGSAVCPYSGINLVLQGRYGIGSRRLVSRSWVYGLFMWFAATVAFSVVAGGL